MTSLVEMIKSARRYEASDLHLTAGTPPIVRVNGEILSLAGYEALAPRDIRDLLDPLMDDHLRDEFEREWKACFSKSMPSLGYFRVSLYKRSGHMEASIRLGILRIPSFEDLGVPAVVEELARRSYGIVLITGSTGAGKTTTFNAILDMINRERRCKIITMEDPIEYVHRPIRSLFIQQEVGTDVKSFPSALIHSLRQDPDVIGIGELREVETIGTALLAAETGHLVVATLHTNDAAGTINRIVDVFPSHKQQQVRYQLAQSLQGVINQRLLPRIDREERVLACEVMVATDAVRNVIRENKAHQLETMICTGSNHGMQSMGSRIKDLYERGIISYDYAAPYLSRQEGNGRKAGLA